MLNLLLGAVPEGDEGGVAHRWRFCCAAKGEMVRSRATNCAQHFHWMGCKGQGCFGD